MRRDKENLQDADGDVRTRIDKTDDPRILIAEGLIITTVSGLEVVADSQGPAEGQVGTVGSCEEKSAA